LCDSSNRKYSQFGVNFEHKIKQNTPALSGSTVVGTCVVCSAERALSKPYRILNNNNWKIEYNIICMQGPRSSIANRGMPRVLAALYYYYYSIFTIQGKKREVNNFDSTCYLYYNDSTWMAPHNVYYLYTIVCLSLHSSRWNTQWFCFFIK